MNRVVLDFLKLLDFTVKHDRLLFYQVLVLYPNDQLNNIAIDMESCMRADLYYKDLFNVSVLSTDTSPSVPSSSTTSLHKIWRFESDITSVYVI
jgi:hypothetical protein